jgi:hypothetical protein
MAHAFGAAVTPTGHVNMFMQVTLGITAVTVTLAW